MKHLRTMKFLPSLLSALALIMLNSSSVLAQGAESILSQLSNEAKAYGLRLISIFSAKTLI